MSKRTQVVHITPLPATVSRKAALGLLHSHVDMIKLNPLVIRLETTSPPPQATTEEAELMTWYEMTDEIQYIPNTSLKGEVTYKGGFYDLPLGLQTHCFAPAGVELWGKWTIGGNQAGEPREPYEIGVDKPKEGLYLKEECILKCSVFLTSFVKKNLKKSHGVLIIRYSTSSERPAHGSLKFVSAQSSRDNSTASNRSTMLLSQRQAFDGLSVLHAHLSAADAVYNAESWIFNHTGFISNAGIASP